MGRLEGLERAVWEWVLVGGVAGVEEGGIVAGSLGVADNAGWE